MSVGNSPESSSQRILVGIILVGRLGIPRTNHYNMGTTHFVKGPLVTACLVTRLYIEDGDNLSMEIGRTPRMRWRGLLVDLLAKHLSNGGSF